MLTEKHENKYLKDFLRELREFQTFDFKHEIELIEKKLKLLSEVKNVNDNDAKHKQSVDHLESLSKRVNDL